MDYEPSECLLFTSSEFEAALCTHHTGKKKKHPKVLFHNTHHQPH